MIGKFVNIRLISVMLMWTFVTGYSDSAYAQKEQVQHANASRLTLPSMREWVVESGYLNFKPASALVIHPKLSKQLRPDAETIAQQLREISHFPWPIKISDKHNAGDIVLTLATQKNTGKEAYSLTIRDFALISGNTPTGVFYGAQSLQQLMQYDSHRARVAKGTGFDYPAIGLRSVMLDIGRHYFEPSQIKELMRDMAWKKLNTIHLHFTDWAGFRLRSDKFPGLESKQSYSRADIDDLEDAAAKYHITIIPEIDLPGHSVPITAYRPSLAFSCPSMRQAQWLPKEIDPTGKAWTVDITKKENTDFLKALLDEFIPWFRGPYFHIGGDEYQFDKEKNACPELVEAAKKKGFSYTGDVFVDWINQTKHIVHAHNKKMIIWSWWRFNDDKTSIVPDKDIIVAAWNPPLQDYIVGEGYETILTPEDTVYVTPGIDGDHGKDNYGLFQSQKVFEQYAFKAEPKAKGYQLSIWADGAMEHTDRYLIGNAYQPMLVFSQRLWSGPAEESFWDMLARANKVGNRLPSPWKDPYAIPMSVKP